MRLTKRTFEREVEQALKASFVRKEKKYSWSEAKNRRGDRFQKSESFDEKKHQKGKEKSDKKKVQCYCCKQFGHFARDS